MPRTDRATGRNYTSRAPLPHPDARRRTRGQQDATYVTTEPPRDDDGAPPVLQVARSTRVPEKTEWVRRVDRVVPNAHNIRMFEGDYHQLVGDRINARPGSVFLVCSKDRRGDEWIRTYIYLPDDIWYDTQTPPVQRVSGWHRIVRNYISGWTALTKVQRVVRACTLAEVALQEAFHAELRGSEDFEAEITPELQATMDAIEHFRSIATMVTGDINELNEDAIRRSFRAWADGVAESTSTSYDAVVNTLSDALVEPTPDTGGVLAEQLQELDSWLPTNTSVANLDEDELTLVMQVVANVTAAVRDERHLRQWQFEVLRRLGMNRRKARDASQDRSLTEILVANEHETAVNYLDRFYDVRSINPATVEEVLQVVANNGATERHELPTKERRLARRIRIGRPNA